MKLYPDLKTYLQQLKLCDDSTPDKRPIRTYVDIARPLKFNLRLQGHVTTRTTALTSFGWSIIGLTDNVALDKLLQRVKPVINKLIDRHVYTALFASSLYEFELNNGEFGSQLKIKKAFKNWEYDFDDSSLYFFDSLTGKYLNKIPLGESTFYLFSSIESEPFGGIMRGILINEILRFDMIMENANYLRKLKGILQILNKGAGPESEQAAVTAAQTAIKDNYLVTDEFIEFKLNQITTAAAGNSFKDFVQMLNDDNSISILGQANTAQLPAGGGSRAALQIQQLISKDIFYADMVRVEALCDNYLQLDYAFNKGKGIIPYKFQFNIAEEKDIEKNASALQMITQVMPLKEDEAYAYVGFTPPKQGDKLLQVNPSNLP